MPIVTVEQLVKDLSTIEDGPEFLRDNDLLVDILYIDTEGHDPLVLRGLLIFLLNSSANI